jgi:MFS family permease
LGLVGAVWAVASALGPVLGGIFAEQLGWRYCFWVNGKSRLASRIYNNPILRPTFYEDMVGTNHH